MRRSARAGLIQFELPHSNGVFLWVPVENATGGMLNGFTAMPIEYEMREGALVWIKNPITGVISYVVDVRGKSFAFTLGGREERIPRCRRRTPGRSTMRFGPVLFVRATKTWRRPN